MAKSFARGILGRLGLGVWRRLLTSSAECLVSIPGLCPGLWKDYDYAMGARVGYAACFLVLHHIRQQLCLYQLLWALSFLGT